jgi:hypothetical protein
MSSQKEILETLKAELDFLKGGGYGRSVRTPWKSTSTFLDSPTCLNFGDPQRTQPCDQCPLMRFVPSGQRSNSVPCHQIPLNSAGDTVAAIERWADKNELEQAVGKWLRTNIKQLEAEQAEAV